MQREKVKEFRLYFNRINVNDVIQNALRPFENQLQEKEIEMEVNLGKNLPPIYADIEKISWVLINLISNAIRYSNRWGKIILEAKLNAKKEKINFSITDFGGGIPEQIIHKIFYTSICSPYNPHPIGVGVALPISKEIVESHNGEMWVESQLGRGSCFYFSIPIADK